MSKPITMKKILKLVSFIKDDADQWCVKDVNGNVGGDVKGHVLGDVRGNVEGDVEGDVVGGVGGSVLERKK